MTYRYNSGTKVSDLHHLEQLKNEADSVLYYLGQIKKDEEFFKNKLKLITQRATEIMQLEYQNIIEVSRREEYNTKHIYYEIYVFKFPKNMNYSNNARHHIFHERIPGREQGKKKCLKLTEELKVKFCTKDVKFYDFK